MGYLLEFLADRVIKTSMNCGFLFTWSKFESGSGVLAKDAFLYCYFLFFSVLGLNLNCILIAGSSYATSRSIHGG